MHKRNLVFVFVGFLVAQGAALADPLVSTASQTPRRDFLKPDTRIHPDALMYSKDFPTGTIRWQTGTIGSVSYKVYDDGGGSTGSWGRRCSQDAMTDFRGCVVSRGKLRLLVGANGLLRIWVGTDHYPGTQVSARIDGGEVFTSKPPGWGVGESSPIAISLLSGKQAAVRFQQWPYLQFVDDLVSLDGLSEALEVARWAVEAKP